MTVETGLFRRNVFYFYVECLFLSKQNANFAPQKFYKR